MNLAELKKEEDAAELERRILVFALRKVKMRLAGFQRIFLLERGWRQVDPDCSSSPWIEPGRDDDTLSFGVTFALQTQKRGQA